MNRFLRKFNLLRSNGPKSTALRVDRRFCSLNRLIYPIKTTFLRRSEAVQLFAGSATQPTISVTTMTKLVAGPISLSIWQLLVATARWSYSLTVNI